MSIDSSTIGGGRVSRSPPSQPVAGGLWAEAAQLRKDQGKLHGELLHLKEGLEALCDVLSEVGVVSTEQLQVQLHRRHFEAARRAHPLGSGKVSLPQAMAAGRPAQAMVLFGGVASSCALRGTSRAQASIIAEAIDFCHQPEVPLGCSPMASSWRYGAECFDPAGGTWRALPPMARRRSAAALGVIGDHLYVCGGFDGQDHLSSCERYDAAFGGTWASIAPMQQRRSGASVGVADGRLYICGGTNAVPARLLDEPLSSAESFNAISEAWEPLASMGQRRCHAAGVVLRGNLYVCGGFAAQDRRLSSAECFVPSVGGWQALAPMTRPRSGMAAGALGDRLYVCGGMASSTELLSSVESFDPATGVWEVLASMGQRRCHAALAIFAGRLYICGGFDGIECLSSTECFDPGVGAWHGLAPMHQCRSGATAAMVDARLYVCGGTQSGVGPLSSMECLDPMDGDGAWDVLASMGCRRWHALVAVLSNRLYVCAGTEDWEDHAAGICMEKRVLQQWRPLSARLSSSQRRLEDMSI